MISDSSDPNKNKTEGKTLKASELASSQDEAQGAKVRRRNSIISIVCLVIFVVLLIWLMRSGKLADTDRIRQMIERSGPFGPILFILISVFTSYIPIVPLGSMGSIGIVLFGALPAFIYNSLTSMINCLIAFWLARRYGTKILLQFASPKTVEKYQGWLAKSRHFELIFFICMMMPVSPDIVLCMLAGMMNMKFSHFLLIIVISRPFSSWCYSTGLLKVFDWIRQAIHL